MTTLWALVVIETSRIFTVQYVELYETKSQCESKMVPQGWFDRQKFYCVPAVKGDK